MRKLKIRSMAPSALQLLVSSLCVLQITNLIVAKVRADIEPSNDISADTTSVQREDRALKLATDSSKDDSQCPHCNVLSEVSCMNQSAFHRNFVKRF